VAIQPTACLQQVVTHVEVYDGQRPLSALRTLRALKNLSAAELARLADIDRSTVRRLEAGVGQPQAKTARKIAAVLNCPPELLFPPNDSAPAANGRADKTGQAGPTSGP
jgi:transcriptional regulator with XRE-family HTH domain